MTNTLKISLKAGEKIYVNGAVIRVDRKVSLEFLNDVQFLLQNHVLQPEDARTPLRQLYFAAQIMLMDPEGAEKAREVFRDTLANLLGVFRNARVLAGLKHVDTLVCEGRVYDALKAIRALYPLEEEILAAGRPREDALSRAVAE
ncbi:flagellar biosynthesis repressor FlbT [Chelativorans intermedius]|uniref:Probable flagellum biosynthesis repressor protein FlbT n=1 Tax=Chelativorans intermedius TaxID=515947 RepID=A0ABV6D8W9_9HYPH|nr:flagellar biosynthesis repressor FlbT [Chelativorans intermedius]MCT8997767.1 flagellar biosynthesis repressor FlbT [Chelativorans intermedius]